ncbi:hypothetical protein RA2_01166 [Roseovarius sp. A-2]|uniref:hypothetical protein n=1 Tax=Roseovarius sp. A-2 TaxID=1570360 RepID=UPI0009B56D17|nr:hypothetical protein [Roseovarius sp. A-2]GAW34121.1 hypothetical protein RA2_01166 [Roseovarius sp. A-2]
MLDASLTHFQSVFADKFFVVPADQNYFLARFTKTYGLHAEFWWQSLQAVEKVLKAGLILNGVSVKRGYSHDLERLWDKHLQTFGDLSVRSLPKPKALGDQHWHNRPLSHFISRLNRMGHPDSRYGLVSYTNHAGDLFKLDKLFFELRRRTIGLDWIVGKGWEDDLLRPFYGQPYRNVIEQLPNHQIRKERIPTGTLATVGTDLEDMYYAWNFAFPRTEGDIEKPAPPNVAPAFPGFRNSYLYLLWQDLNGKAVTHDMQGKVGWLLANVMVGKEAEIAFKKLLNNQ